MKRVNQIILSVIIAISLCGCNFLEVKKIGKNDIPKHFSDMEGLRNANIGMYRLLYNFYNAEYMKYSELAGDLVELYPNIPEMRDQYDFISKPEDQASAQANMWVKGYEVLANANMILKYVPDLKEKYSQHSGEIDNIAAQALFVRALMHHFICNCFAQPYNYTADGSHIGIPVVTKLPGAKDPVPRDKVNAVYKRITDDLDQAVKLFGNTTITTPYFVSGMACKALQARIYLYMGNNEKARDCASDVISQMSLTANNKYIDMIQAVNVGSEAIFRLNGSQIGHGLRSFYGPLAPMSVMVSSKLMNSFYDNRDIRRQLIYGNSIMKYYHPYYSEPTIPDEKYIPYAPFVLRLSEMYLIRAEAYTNLNENGKAESDIKDIIARAMGKLPSEITLSYSGSEELLKMVDRERILELYAEGHRFFDILRRKQDLQRSDDTNSSVKYLKYPNGKFVLPIPQRELDANKGMEQNEEYIVK